MNYIVCLWLSWHQTRKSHVVLVPRETFVCKQIKAGKHKGDETTVKNDVVYMGLGCVYTLAVQEVNSYLILDTWSIRNNHREVSSAGTNWKTMRRKPKHTCVTGSTSASLRMWILWHTYIDGSGRGLGPFRFQFLSFSCTFLAKNLPNNNLPPPPRQILDPPNDETKI